MEHKDEVAAQHVGSSEQVAQNQNWEAQEEAYEEAEENPEESLCYL